MTDEYDAKAQKIIEEHTNYVEWAQGVHDELIAAISSALRSAADAVIEECAAALDQRTKENDYAPSGGSDFLRSLKSSPGRVVDLVQATTETNGPQNGQLHSEWRPIETAPKDGTSILLWQPKVKAVGWWDAEYDLWKTGRESYMPNPTHWRPLPSPPKSQGDSTVEVNNER